MHRTQVQDSSLWQSRLVAVCLITVQMDYQVRLAVAVVRPGVPVIMQRRPD